MIALSEMDAVATPLSSDSFCTNRAESKLLGSPEMIIVLRTAAVSPDATDTSGGYGGDAGECN